MDPERSSYTFGDSDLAAHRLALLAETFGPTTARFLRMHRNGTPSLVVDLGCGPGYTTELLRDILRPGRTMAIDSSRTYVELVAQRLGSSAEVLCADALALPDIIRDVDVIFARFLLTHLADPLRAIAQWLERLGSDGVFLSEEVESITTDEPTLVAYLNLQREMLRANGNELEIGPLLAQVADTRAQVISSELAILSPPTAVAARMFAMNFATWRHHPLIAERHTGVELDGIAIALDDLAAQEATSSAITWRLRHAVLRADESRF